MLQPGRPQGRERRRRSTRHLDLHPPPAQVCSCADGHARTVHALALECRAVCSLVQTTSLWQRVKRRVAEVDWNSAGRLERQVKYLFKGNWLLLLEAQNLCTELLLARLEVLSSEHRAVRGRGAAWVHPLGCQARTHTLGDTATYWSQYCHKSAMTGDDTPLHSNSYDDMMNDFDANRNAIVSDFSLTPNALEPAPDCSRLGSVDDYVDIRMEKSRDLYFPGCLDSSPEPTLDALIAESMASDKLQKGLGVTSPETAQKPAKKERFRKARAFWRRLTL